MNRSLVFAIPLLGIASIAYAQQRVQPAENRATAAGDATHQLPANAASAASDNPDYVLGPGDQISLTVTDLDDQFTDKTFRIDTGGDISIPYAGRLQAAGLTTGNLEKEIESHLGNILKEPHVVVNITEFHSQPVSVLGEVNSPGLHQVQGDKTLFEALSLAGGFTDNLGNKVTITRKLKWGPIPLPNAHSDPTGQFSVLSLNVRGLVNASNPADNIPVMPEDVITVSRTEVVYAVGSVNKPGGFQLGQQESLSALQVLSLAEGLNKTAAPQRALILRAVDGSKTRTQIPVDVKRLMEGKGTDQALQAQDILFIPNSKAKAVSYRTLDAILQTASGVAVYGRY